MTTRFIINQDRDRILPFNGNALVYTAPVIHDGTCFGHKLVMDGAYLGNFDTQEEAAAEAFVICNYSGDIYAVSGYSDWQGEN